jgi:hypothetical protein
MEGASAQTKPAAVPADSSPEEELRAIYRRKTGDEISMAVERRIWEAVEVRLVTRQRFIEELRKHAPNYWRNPPGFLTDFARKIGVVSTPEARPSAPPEPERNGHGRCSLCNGLGRDGEAYCECQTGRDLQLVEARAARLVKGEPSPVIEQAS